MKDKVKIPFISQLDIENGIKKAQASDRKRHPKILHQQGAEFNKVFNFLMKETYMQPHLHPGDEKIENIHILQGELAVIFFDNEGEIDQVIRLERNNLEHVKVPAFNWHTYVVLSDFAITYETMMGKYDPKSWKEMAVWAPEENTIDSNSYLETLKNTQYLEL